PFTPTVPGTYHWIATYSGDANNAPTATVCDDTNESVIVAAAVVPAGAGIPTLSGWGLMTLMVLVVLASIYRLRKL
ncbi:MAG: IPTL-CTERM sorting domain-containing protein, partial [Isosphaeraceae bacterium]